MKNENKYGLKVTTEQEILSEFIKTLDSVELDVVTQLLKNALVMDDEQFQILQDESFLSDEHHFARQS